MIVIRHEINDMPIDSIRSIDSKTSASFLPGTNAIFSCAFFHGKNEAAPALLDAEYLNLISFECSTAPNLGTIETYR
jgi:hypothetical protein